MKRIFLFLFFFSQNIYAEETRVLLFVNSYDQVDSIGFNIVEAIPGVVYGQVLAGKITLWDSPGKEVKIEPRTLLQIEKDAQSSFRVTNQLFIYESWSRDRKSLTIRTVGFYFSAKKPNGEEVAYGFVEYGELDSLFQTTQVPANANGTCSLTFHDALMQKQYNYNIVQYGGKRVESVSEALAIKDDIKALLPGSKQSGGGECKIIRYSIEDSALSKAPEFEASRRFLAAAGKYLAETPEFFLNIGGDQLTTDPSVYKMQVVKAEVEERWVRNGDTIEHVIDSMKIYVNNRPLNALSLNEIQHLDFLVGFKSVYDFLKEKEFYFRILKINSQEIPPEKAAAYLEGIKEMRWSHLIEWARYQ